MHLVCEYGQERRRKEQEGGAGGKVEKGRRRQRRGETKIKMHSVCECWQERGKEGVESQLLSHLLSWKGNGSRKRLTHTAPDATHPVSQLYTLKAKGSLLEQVSQLYTLKAKGSLLEQVTSPCASVPHLK